MTTKLNDYQKIGLALPAGLALAIEVLFFLSWLAEGGRNELGMSAALNASLTKVGLIAICG
jgi:hypothetical protein